MKYRSFLIIALLFAKMAAAQNFGGFPPATKWKQINTDTARIIFTAPAQWQAQRIAGIIHKMAADTPVAIGNNVKKINVVLHNKTTLANGYVQLAPFRSEYYLVPASNIFEFGNLPWHENLAVHEYRHVQQYNNFNNGLTKIFKTLLGQQGQAFANAITIPDWFFEGDAVYAETAFTEMGRGRTPYFLSAYNSLWQEDKNYSWLKLRNGSYKDYVPNHYNLGYLLTNYGYLKYGDEFWKNVTKDASAFKGLVYPFQKAIKKYAGVDYKTFRKEALQYYSRQVDKRDFKMLQKNNVVNYQFPQAINNDSIVYVKETYNQLPAFYIKDKTGEHKIVLRSISAEDWFSYRNGVIAYTAFDVSSRWSLIDYSDIVLLDVHTKQERRITSKAKYYTPDIAPNGKSIIAVAVNDSLQTELHLLDANGVVLKRIPATGHNYFVHPKFIDDENIVVGERTEDGNMYWNLLNIHTGSGQQLISAGTNTIGYPSVHKDIIYFVSSVNGNDDIYAYKLKEKKVFQLTTGKTGYYYPSATEDSIVFSQFTAEGLQLQQKSLKDFLWTEVAAMHLQEKQLQYAVADGGENLLQQKGRNFAVKDYSKTTGLVNIHSWDPFLTLYSNNILNTLSSSAYYQYNESEKSHKTGINASYGGFFPVINAGAEYTFDRHIRLPNKTIRANEWVAKLGYNIPLNFTKGKTLKSLNFGSNFVHNKFIPTDSLKISTTGDSYNYLHHFITWGQQLQRAKQHIYPKLGYAFSGGYRHRLDNQMGYQFNGSTALYLPSVFKNHSIVLTGSFQQVDTFQVKGASNIFSNRFTLARGYPDYYYSRMWNAGFNYHMPLLYPDFGVASIVYFMRVRSNFYFDYSRVYSNNKTRSANLKSVGTEIYFDTKWWNQLPVTFGVRYSYLLDQSFANGNRNRFELIVPVNLIPNF